jgi:hypothetical protein
LLSVLAITPALAGVGFMAGIQYDFGKGSFDQSFGVTAKAMTSDRQDQLVGAAASHSFRSPIRSSASTPMSDTLSTMAWFWADTISSTIRWISVAAGQTPRVIIIMS